MLIAQLISQYIPVALLRSRPAGIGHLAPRALRIFMISRVFQLGQSSATIFRCGNEFLSGCGFAGRWCGYEEDNLGSVTWCSHVIGS